MHERSGVRDTLAKLVGRFQIAHRDRDILAHFLSFFPDDVEPRLCEVSIKIDNSGAVFPEAVPDL